MRRLGIVSDSHGERSKLRRAWELLGDCDAYVHLGDCARDLQGAPPPPGVPLYSVRGNCDFAAHAPEEITFRFGGLCFLACHGHRYRVKEQLTYLSLRAREAGADVVLFGHTHMPCVERDGPLLLVNPGALMDGRVCILEMRENGPCPVMKIL